MLEIGLAPGECPTCGEEGVTIHHIKTCRALRAADLSELDEMRRMNIYDDWAQNWPSVDFEAHATWKE